MRCKLEEAWRLGGCRIACEFVLCTQLRDSLLFAAGLLLRRKVCGPAHLLCLRTFVFVEAWLRLRSGPVGHDLRLLACEAVVAWSLSWGFDCCYLNRVC